MDRGLLSVTTAGQDERGRARAAYERLRVEHEANLLALVELRERGTGDGLVEDLEARMAWNAAALDALREAPLLS
jgi:hypothetical protein